MQRNIHYYMIMFEIYIMYNYEIALNLKVGGDWYEIHSILLIIGI